ncbi:MAG: tyrosine-protein phosphatase [Dysgonamonadaceae bacterium]|nr:tyrosine-protein phosphatase [Dysgonamonadaceae bacterium]
MQKLGVISFAIALLLFGNGCASTIKITSVAEKDKDGEFLLKWEVSPDQEGKIDIYSSASDSSLNAFTPVASTDISDQVARINPTQTSIREFFLLSTSGVYSGIVSNRVIEMDKIKNFRDVGGYYSMDNKQLRWGKIFRSGDLSNANLFDQERIKRLGIRTVVDFRSDKNAQAFPLTLHPDIRRVSLPIPLMDNEVMEKHINEKNFTRADAIRYVQDSYIDIIENYKKEFGEMFDLLTGESNYPILLSEALGKDRVGLASFLILSALGVPESAIMDDYLLSNRTIDVRTTIDYAQTLPEYMQEAITAMLSVNRVYLEYTIDYIKQRYGSVDNYLEKELKVSQGKKTILRKYLFYNP